MKTVRVHETGGPEALRVEDCPRLAPGPEQILVRVKAIGVNPVDTYLRSGQQGYSPPLPYTPGLDGAGVVAAIGAAVGEHAVGDRVYVSGSVTGTYAEEVLCLAHHVHRLPDPLSFSEGAALGVPYATAFRALFQRAELRAGEWLLVHGASGGVGIAAVQLARRAGLRVIGTAGSEPGRQLLTQLGVSAALDHHDPHHSARIMALTEGHGVDAIIEMAAHLNLAEDLSLLACRGRVVVVGSRGPIEINPRDTMSRDAAILGMSLMNLSPEETKAIHRTLAQDYAAGRLRPVVRTELPFESAAEAHRLVMEGKSLGKIVLLP